MHLPHGIRALILLLALVAAAQGVLAGHIDPMEGLLQLEDLDPGFSFDEPRSGCWPQGSLTQCTASFGRTEPAEVLFGTGPFYVSSLLMTSDDPLFPQMVPALAPLAAAGALVGIGQSGLEPFDVEGPLLGDGTHWFGAQGVSEELPLEFYGVSFGAGNYLAVVMTGGFQGRVSAAHTAELAVIVAERLAQLSAAHET